MEKNEHFQPRPTSAPRWAPTYHAAVQPFPKALPELNAVGHSSVAQARAGQQAQLPAPTLAIVVPRRGGQRFFINGQWFSPVGGEMLLIPPDAQIGFGDAPITRIDSYDLYLRLDQPQPFLGDRRYESIREKLLSLPTTQAKAPPHAVGTIRNMYRRIQQRRDDPLTVPWLTLNLGVLLLEILDAVLNRPVRGAPAYVADAERFLREHLFEPINLPQLVSHTGYSRSALVEAFRQQHGVPPMEWHLRLKIDHACKQLICSNEPVRTLGMRLGFSSSQYFATVFKRFMAITPSAYRRR